MGEAKKEDRVETICRRCRQSLVMGPLGHWAHLVNPRHRHHYPKPMKVPA